MEVQVDKAQLFFTVVNNVHQRLHMSDMSYPSETIILLKTDQSQDVWLNCSLPKDLHGRNKVKIWNFFTIENENTINWEEYVSLLIGLYKNNVSVCVLEIIWITSWTGFDSGQISIETETCSFGKFVVYELYFLCCLENNISSNSHKVYATNLECNFVRSWSNHRESLPLLAFHVTEQLSITIWLLYKWKRRKRV